ncbi:ArsR/SmtB family transcription factor [Streptomyces sp. NPDC059788]|uniref:ArsR/SmtB family transcription factor n=1 Tax=Streptomyces sp. NPDC059788 TaxID=3346948 RepID=UPI003669139A
MAVPVGVGSAELGNEVPHFFCGMRPRPLLNADDTPVPACPVPVDLNRQIPPGVPVSEAASRGALSSLVGRTRAQVLDAVAERPHSRTAQLAHCLSLSMASVSEHTATLREARLIDSYRHRGTVRHLVTPLGAQLLSGTEGRIG